jgi:hypothetical protein
MEHDKVDLTGIAEKGYVRFSIKAEDSPYNVSVHSAFKEFCSVECDNNYTLGLKKLLEHYERDAHYEALWDGLSALRQEVEDLKLKVVAPVVEKKKEVGNEVF